MAKKMDWVEVDPITSMPIRIIKTTREAMSLPAEVVRQMAHSAAVGFIRTQVVNRARRGKIIQCEYCGEPINEFIGEMHEKIPRGDGGEISLANCVFICHDCHTGKSDSEHGDRRWQTSKKQSF